MPRPIPHSRYLADLAQRTRTTFRRDLDIPTLLHSEPGSGRAVLSDHGDKAIYIVNLRPPKLLLKLALPSHFGRARDLRAFTFSGNLRAFGAYDTLSHHFAVWSLETGKLINDIQGSGEAAPRIEFPGGSRVATCDGRNISVHKVGGTLTHLTELPGGVRSVALHIPEMENPAELTVAAVFRRGEGGHQLRSLRVENGRIVEECEGPYRPRPSTPGMRNRILFHEFLTVPGATRRLLVALEEEERLREDVDTHNPLFKEYTTRLLALDPQTGEFLEGDAEVPGRHCLERRGSGLELVDEYGRRREVIGPPMGLQVADWRLAG